MGADETPGERASTLDPMRIGLLRALTLLRVGLLVWATIVLAVEAGGAAQVRLAVGVALLGALAAWTALQGAWLWGRRPGRVADPASGVVDLALAVVAAGADHLVFSGPHPQSFASAWPMSAAVATGIVRGPWAGALSGATIGTATAIGTAWFREGGLEGTWTATLGTLVLLSLAGGLAGVLARLLVRAEDATARARAREDVARRLHDGVLQTLAVVQRRSDDPELRRLAREQELDLRSFLDDRIDPASAGHDEVDPVPALRTALAHAERRTGVQCQLTVIDAASALPGAAVDALTAAVGELVVNADKHGSARRVVACLDLDAEGRTTCSVLDDGVGFDPAATDEGTGLRRSVRGRLHDVGGEVQLHARPGHGCEVRLTLPAP